jgi:hypothetical protein
LDKRYQVFVSSTFTDLKEERKKIIENLINAKYIPAGMEMFSASNDEQFKYIKKILDTCDYYILVIGARYGSINPTTGISYTEQEYDYAVSKNIPVLAFLHNDPYNLPADKREDDKKDYLEAFRLKVSTGRMCRLWGNTNELITSVIISLTEEVAENPQKGWTRGASFDSIELLSQLNEVRLEKENLEKEIVKLKAIIKQSNTIVDNLACGNDKFIIKGEKYVRYYGSISGSYEPHEVTLSWDEIFSAVGPFLFAYENYSSFKNKLESGINSAYNQDFYALNQDSVQTIKIQLHALGLIDIKPSKAENGSAFEFIAMTEKGKSYLLQLKTLKNK